MNRQLVNRMGKAVALRSTFAAPIGQRSLFVFGNVKATEIRREARQRQQSLFLQFLADKNWYAGTDYIQAARYIQAQKQLAIRKLRYSGEEQFAGYERFYILAILAVFGFGRFVTTYHRSALNWGKLGNDE